MYWRNAILREVFEHLFIPNDLFLSASYLFTTPACRDEREQVSRGTGCEHEKFLLNHCRDLTRCSKLECFCEPPCCFSQLRMQNCPQMEVKNQMKLDKAIHSEKSTVAICNSSNHTMYRSITDTSLVGLEDVYVYTPKNSCQNWFDDVVLDWGRSRYLKSQSC